MKKGNLLLLSACLFGVCLNACQTNTPKSSKEEPIIDNVPETGKADRSSLKYATSLDSYKKATGKAIGFGLNIVKKIAM